MLESSSIYLPRYSLSWELLSTIHCSLEATDDVWEIIMRRLPLIDCAKTSVPSKISQIVLLYQKPLLQLGIA
jgi:hypothetical protein